MSERWHRRLRGHESVLAAALRCVQVEYEELEHDGLGCAAQRVRCAALALEDAWAVLRQRTSNIDVGQEEGVFIQA